MPKAELNWNGRMAFTTTAPSGVEITFDTGPDEGGDLSGPSPVETLVCSLAACTGMDVASLMPKMRLDVTDYRIEVEWERGPIGVWPRPVTKVTLMHYLKGNDLDLALIEKAIRLSEDKYCSVLSTIRSNPEFSSNFEIEV